MISYYYNGAGQRFPLPERPLEPPDCRADERGCINAPYPRGRPAPWQGEEQKKELTSHGQKK